VVVSGGSEAISVAMGDISKDDLSVNFWAVLTTPALQNLISF